MYFRIAEFPQRHDFFRTAATVATAAAMALALVLAPLSSARADDEMTFESVNYGGVNAISATGRITDRTPGMFLDFLQKNSRGSLHAVVFLDSPGGIVLASMQLGTLWRKLGVAAVVARVSGGFFGGNGNLTSGRCLSACVYALIGARKRVIPPQSEVGIHKMFLTVDGADVSALASQKDRATAKSLRSLLSSYASRMGVNPEIIASAERTPSEHLHILTQAEIKRWHLGVPDM
jgi:hypothetical protein